MGEAVWAFPYATVRLVVAELARAARTTNFTNSDGVHRLLRVAGSAQYDPGSHTWCEPQARSRRHVRLGAAHTAASADTDNVTRSVVLPGEHDRALFPTFRPRLPEG